MKIGIDLGTSYSSVAAEVNGKIEMIRVSTGASAFGDSYSMPTAVYMDKDSILLGQAALNKRKISPSCFKSEFKRDLGTSTPFILGEEEYLPEQLYTEFFLYFKKQAAEQMGEKIDKAFITHPANYGNNKKRLIEKSANNAGLFDVVLVDEPTAAAAGYAQKNKITDGDILLVYDLGGGTFDVAIIKKTAKGYVHLTEPLGISQCGGVDFDRVIFDDIMNKMTQSGEFDIDRIMKEKRFTAALSEVCIQIKHQLSQADSHTEPIAVGFDYFDYTITRQKFEELIRPFAANTCEKVKDILKNSGLIASDIDRVLLVGGSSRVPLVRKMVQETLQKDISLDADPELAVCQGAVCLGLMGKEDVIVKDQEPGNNQDIEEKRADDRKNVESYIKGAKDKHEAQEESQKKEEHHAKESIMSKNSISIESPERMEKIMTYVVLGKYATDGGWIYYPEYKEGIVCSLCKVKRDGTQKTKLSDNCTIGQIRIEGEWVYFQGIRNFYRVKKDGTGETMISKECNSGFYDGYAVKDGWIYFVNDNLMLSKMRIDGSCCMLLSDNKYVSNIAVEKDWIYYTYRPHIHETLCKMRIDGTQRTEILRSKGFINHTAVYNDWVLYAASRKEKKWMRETTEHELWKIRVDGTENQKILSDFSVKTLSQLNIIDGWLYYDIYKNDKIHRMRLDGVGKQEVNLKMLQLGIAAIKK